MNLRTAAIALSVFALPLAPADAQQQTPEPEAEVPQSALLALPALKSAGPAWVHEPGPVKRGDTLVSMPVTHAITGTLRQQVTRRGLFAGGAFMPAGAPVFAVPMSGNRGSALIWCAPRSDERDGRVRWSTVCFPKGTGITPNVWVAAHTPLFPTFLVYSDSTTGATEVSVEPEAVDLPAMKINFRFTEWDKDDADIFVSIDAPGGDAQLGNRSLPRLPDGTVRLKAFGGEFKLTQVGTDRHAATLEVITPPSETPRPEL